MSEAQTKPETAQERFDRLYVTSTEIAHRLRVTAPTVFHARRRGDLPDPIVINRTQIYIWERALIEPAIQAYEARLASRRGVLRSTTE